MKKIFSNIFQALYSLMPAEKEAKLTNDAEAYWNSSESSNKKQDLSHWRNAGRWDDLKWLGIGEANFSKFEDLCLMSNSNKESIQTMVEWGQGGGANAIRFSKHVREFFGVDISQPNLYECAKQLNISGFNGFKPILISAGNPEICLQKISKPIDFFLSTAVFQHFPSKLYGIRILKLAHQMLKIGGIALIQIRYQNINRKFDPKRRSYKKNAITFTSYSIDEFWNICQGIGLNPLYISITPQVNYAYYFLKKNKL